MLRVVLGPTFDIHLDRPRDEVAAQLSTWVRQDHCPFDGRTLGDNLTLTVREPDRHFWSPWLTLDVRDQQDAAGCLVHGRFNPHPSIWSAVIFSALALLTISLVAACWGLAQLLMDAAPSAWLVIPACFLFAGALFWISHLGQVIADDQMNRIRAAIDTALTPPA